MKELKLIHGVDLPQNKVEAETEYLTDDGWTPSRIPRSVKITAKILYVWYRIKETFSLVRLYTGAFFILLGMLFKRFFLDIDPLDDQD